MELILSEQVPFDELYTTGFDLVIASSGYENRCTYLVDRLGRIDAVKRVLAFRDKTKDLSRPENDRRFRELDFTFIDQSGDECIDAEKLIGDLPAGTGKSRNVLIDYSCMTKVWYASLIDYFINADLLRGRLTAYFSYSGSEYSEPKKTRTPRIVEPLGCSKSKLISHKPVALVLGLGYEKDRAEMLYRSLEPEQTYVFYADPTDDDRFVEKVYVNNFSLIDKLHRNQVINYPIRDLGKIDELLTGLCLDLRLSYRVILAPLGPKPFSLCCLLLAARYPDIEVWRISAGPSERLYERKGRGDPLVYKAVFSEDEDYPR